MKYLKQNIIKIITGTAEEVQDETNVFVNGLINQGIEPSVRVEVNPLTSIIQYQLEIRQAENAEDRFRERGIKHHCGDCKHFSKREDGRVKWGECTRRKEINGLFDRTKNESPACNSFYEELERKEIYFEAS